MSKPWIKLADLQVNLEQIPSLLDRYNLLPDFLRRLLETNFTYKIKPEKDEQIKFFNSFYKKKIFKAKKN